MPDLYKYATAVHLYKPMIKRGVIDFAVSADWTPAAGDVKISIDGGAAANVTNLPVAITMGNGALWDFSMTSGELTGKKIRITVVDSATKAVEDNAFEIDTYGNASAQYAVDFTDGVHFGLSALPNVASGSAGAIPTTGTGANQINVSSGVVDANTKNVTGIAIMTGTARTSASNTTTAIALPASWNSPGNINVGDKLEFFAGTGAGESGIATSFTGLGTSTPVANTISTGWSGGVVPDGTTQFRVLPGYGLIPIDGTTLASATQVGAIQATTSKFGFDPNNNVNANLMGVNQEPWTGSTKPYTVAT